MTLSKVLIFNGDQISRLNLNQKWFFIFHKKEILFHSLFTSLLEEFEKKIQFFLF
jgi:hypothetical protein